MAAIIRRKPCCQKETGQKPKRSLILFRVTTIHPNSTLFFITFLTVRSLSAQPQVYALSGSVRDSATGKPIAAVSVFLNGTSKGTTTHDDGTFLLTGIPAGGYQLIISAISYATFPTVINTSRLPANLDIILQSRPSEITAVTVKPNNQNGWNK